MRHGQIQDDQGDAVLLAGELLDGFAAVGGDDDLEARPLQHATAQVADGVLVVGKQDFSRGVIGGGKHDLGLQLAGLAFAGREKQLEGRAAIGFAVDPDGAVVAAHDTQHGGQPQPASGELGREERVEDSIHGGLVHAMTGIGDFHIDVVAGWQAVRAETTLEDSRPRNVRGPPSRR